MDSGPRLKSRSSFSFHPPVFILLPLEGIRSACGDQPNDLVALSVAVAHDQRPQPRAEPEQNKPVLVLRMFLVWTHQGVFVEEHRPGFLEGYPVPSTVHRRLPLVPFEAKLFHPPTSVPTS